jgi:hypothetical protein
LVLHCLLLSCSHVSLCSSSFSFLIFFSYFLNFLNLLLFILFLTANCRWKSTQHPILNLNSSSPPQNSFTWLLSIPTKNLICTKYHFIFSSLLNFLSLFNNELKVFFLFHLSKIQVDVC